MIMNTVIKTVIVTSIVVFVHFMAMRKVKGYSYSIEYRTDSKYGSWDMSSGVEVLTKMGIRPGVRKKWSKTLYWVFFCTIKNETNLSKKLEIQKKRESLKRLKRVLRDSNRRASIILLGEHYKINRDRSSWFSSRSFNSKKNHLSMKT